jgi:hypothetical protein
MSIRAYFTHFYLSFLLPVSLVVPTMGMPVPVLLSGVIGVAALALKKRLDGREALCVDGEDGAYDAARSAAEPNR